MDKISIVKWGKAKKIYNNGDILYPFIDWKEQNTLTGGGWYSKPNTQEDIKSKDFLMLNNINANGWKALDQLEIEVQPFKDMIKYECPYADMTYFWTVPICIWTNDLDYWLKRGKVNEYYFERLKDKEWMVQWIFGRKKEEPYSLPVSKANRALLGTGYTGGTGPDDGNGHIHDANIALSNGDYLGAKVWIWFNK